MANTYTQIHIQFVFAVKHRKALIHSDWEDFLYKYMTAIIQQQSHKVLQINGMPDHIHVFIGMRPTQSMSDLIKKVKGETSAWINREGFCCEKFAWQSGYGAFSYAKSQVPRVIRYIQNQKEHHRHKAFLKEHVEFLETFDVEYDERYIFKPLK